MERNELRIGQTVYIEPVGNAARYGTDIIETKISKIGKKYIETEKFGEMYKFNISDGKQKEQDMVTDMIIFCIFQDRKLKINRKRDHYFLILIFVIGIT